MTNIRSLLKNEVAKKILLFFYENPHSIDTPKGIATWISCDPNNVLKVLNTLVKEGILLIHRTASINAYSLTNKRDVTKEIDKYISKPVKRK